MIAALALTAASVPALKPAPVWVPVGETALRLRVFVDRASVFDAHGLRHARIRMGSPTAITGRIVLVYQDEEFDCTGGRWRMLAFDARDENDKIVEHSIPTNPPFHPIVELSVGGAVAKAVCNFAPARLPSTSSSASSSTR